MNCEICGKETKDLVKIVIEGTILKVCMACAKYGKIIDKKEEVEEKVVKEIEDFYEDIVEDYAKRIKEAREKTGLSIKEFCKKYNLKENIMRKIERGELVPDIELARKLEKILKIKLIEKKKYKYGTEKGSESKIYFSDIVSFK